MTAEELDCKAQMNPARIQRIARGLLNIVFC